MRSFIYWLTTTAVAVLCMSAAATPDAHEGVLAASDVALFTDNADPMRAVLLGVGIMAMAYTFRRAWLNFTETAPRA